MNLFYAFLVGLVIIVGILLFCFGSHSVAKIICKKFKWDIAEFYFYSVMGLLSLFVITGLGQCVLNLIRTGVPAQ